MFLFPDPSVAHFACTNYRGVRRRFGIKQPDRRSHLYLIGKTGTGKSTLLETLMRHDLATDNGLALFDPHGDLVERVRRAVPPERQCDLIHFDAADSASGLGFNPLEGVVPAHRGLATSFLLDAFRRIWWESWGPRLEHILRHALLALIDVPWATLADILRLLDDAAFRRSVISRVYNPQVRNFWLREYESYPARFRAEAIAPIQNKVGAFLAHPRLQRILTQPQSSFALRSVMDEGRILLINLAKGRLGQDAAALLGALMLSGLQVAALSRADTPETERRDFFIYVDEFPSFATSSLTSMLAELRKYHVGLVLAHQHLSQLEFGVRDAILGNVGTLVTFRLSLADAEFLEREFRPEFGVEDLIGLPNHHVYLKLLIDGVVSRPFSAEVERPEALASSR